MQCITMIDHLTLTHYCILGKIPIGQEKDYITFNTLLRWQETIILKLGKFTSKWFAQAFGIEDKLLLLSKFIFWRKGVK